MSAPTNRTFLEVLCNTTLSITRVYIHLRIDALEYIMHFCYYYVSVVLACITLNTFTHSVVTSIRR